ncbi:MAG TPA: alanine racemase [Roseimicrobium sp.]|nr:alanine racemase [Roseimicrobium sp.]
MNHRCWAEVDLDALRENLAWLRHRVGPKVKVMTVVKADAYGHGLKQIATLLMQSGTDIFGVANLAEARAVRGVGKGWPVLMLGACLPDEVETAVRDGVMPTISSLEEARWFSDAATKLHREVAVHVKVDTGMGRLGMRPDVAAGLIAEIRALPRIRIEGLFTHFAAAEDDPRFSRTQRSHFEKVLRELGHPDSGIPTIHANNSAAVLFESKSIYNLIRPGLIVYGILPPGKRPATSRLHRQIRPAMTWKCRVSLVKRIPKGATLSYGRSFKAPREMNVATITAGYGDGYFRSAGNRSSVLIDGKRCPVLGRVTMDQMLVDVSEVSDPQPGDEVVLMGSQGKECITTTELAGWCGTIPWEILTNITYRVPRVYRGGQAS